MFNQPGKNQPGKVAVLKISAGTTVAQGFSATLELAQEGQQPFRKIAYQLPPAPGLFEQYGAWQRAYRALGETTRWRWHRVIVPSYQKTNFSQTSNTQRLWDEVKQQGKSVEELLLLWFEQSSFRDLREDLIDGARINEPLRLILETDDPILQRLPWHYWPLFQVRPNAELVLAAPYQGGKEKMLRSPLKILVILGLCDQLDVETDFQTLTQQFPDAQIRCLANPTLSLLKDTLFYESWDVLLFAGHSASDHLGDSGGGSLGLGNTTVPIRELTEALTVAVRKGLKLAIFNSCDGLGLAQGVSSAHVPNVVVMREPIPDDAAHDFLRYFLQAFQAGEAFHLAVRHARERLQDLSQTYPQATWLPVIFQNPSAPSFQYRRQRRKRTIVLFSLCLFAALLGVGWWGSQVFWAWTLASRISHCEDLLIPLSKQENAKQRRSSACAQKNWQAAVTEFETSLRQNRNDPETRIYLNNARILANQTAHFTVVVSVPIGSNVDVAQEMLRGVAQAQTQFNEGSNEGKKLLVVIANDDNDTELSKQLAQQFVGDRNILAVIGHNATNASMAGAKVYNPKGLVMLTPTSFAADLSFYNVGKQYPYAFRMVPDMVTVSQMLSAYMQRRGDQTIAVCVDTSAEDNASFGQDFMRTFKGTIVDVNCDFAQPDFSPEQAIKQIAKTNAQAIVIATHVDRLKNGIDLARINAQEPKPLTLYGSPSFYTQLTLEQGQAAMAGMVIPSLWTPENLPVNHPFLQKAMQLWGGPVTWRTAMSYDATNIIAEGLREIKQASPTGFNALGFNALGFNLFQSVKPSERAVLQQYLANPKFSHEGITGPVQFRVTKPKSRTMGLLKVVPDAKVKTGYKFQLLSHR